MSIKIVTGYVRLQNHPRSHEKYQELGNKLGEVRNPISAFTCELHDCWLHRFVTWKGCDVTHSSADNPKKNTLGFHAVQHQKTAWLLQAASMDPGPDVFVWIDLGIFHIPGMTREAIEAFLVRAERAQAVVIPGWLGNQPTIDDSVPSWRFCGGVIVCPRSYVFELDGAFKQVAMQRINETKNVTWEVNTLARLELERKLPICWYHAGFNVSMFDNYPEARYAS